MIAIITLNIILRLVISIFLASWGVFWLRSGEVRDSWGRRFTRADNPSRFWFAIIVLFGFSLYWLCAFIRDLLR